MEKPQIKSPQVEGLKHFLIQIPHVFSAEEIQDLPQSVEFRRIAQAIQICKTAAKASGSINPSEAAEHYNYSCIVRTICPQSSKQFIQCYRQAQVTPGLSCETQRREVETCVGDHVSQAVYAIDSGSLSAGDFAPPAE